MKVSNWTSEATTPQASIAPSAADTASDGQRHPSADAGASGRVSEDALISEMKGGRLWVLLAIGGGTNEIMREIMAREMIDA